MDENNLQLPFPGAAEEYKYNGTVCFVYQKAQGVGGGEPLVCVIRKDMLTDHP